jgi:hypothetical protein
MASPNDATNSKPAPDIPQRDERLSRPTWADIPALISGVAVFAFVSSTLYVGNITAKFNFPVRDYLDLIDYVQVLPLYWSGIFVLLFFVLLFCGWYSTIILRHQAAVYGTRKIENATVWKKRTRVRAFFRIVRTLNAILVLVVAFLIFFLIFLNAGDTLTDEINGIGVSQVFQKGQSCPLEGKIFVNGHRYILLLNEKGDLLTAIPQAEVQMIQTARNSPLPSRTFPTRSASPAAPVTSSTAPEPK